MFIPVFVRHSLLASGYIVVGNNGLSPTPSSNEYGPGTNPQPTALKAIYVAPANATGVLLFLAGYIETWLEMGTHSSVNLGSLLLLLFLV